MLYEVITQCGDVDAARVVQCAAGIRRCDQYRAAFAKEAHGMLAYCTEALYCHTSAGKRETRVLQGNLRGVSQSPASRADLVQRDSSKFSWQSDGAPDLVVNPGHALLVSAHVRSDEVIVLVGQCAGKGAVV